jgi:predicted O-methyltransferase YrrM
MRIGPRKQAAVGVAVIAVVVAVTLAAVGVVTVGEALLLLLGGTVLVAVAFVDVRTRRGLERVRSQLDGRVRHLERAVAAIDTEPPPPPDVDGLEALVDERLAALERGVVAEQATLRRLAEDTVRTVAARVARLEVSTEQHLLAAPDRVQEAVTGALAAELGSFGDRLDRRADLDLRLIAATVGLQTSMSELPLPPLRRWVASPDLLAYLYRLVVSCRPQVIVECGSGVSTVVLASALRAVGGGRLVSLEHQAPFADRTRTLLATRGLEGYVDVVSAPLVDHRVGDDLRPWYDLTDVDTGGPVDLLFVDGPPGTTAPQARFPAVPLLLDRLAPGVVVVLDDANREDEVTTLGWWRDLLPSHEQASLAHEKGTAVLAPDGSPALLLE